MSLKLHLAIELGFVEEIRSLALELATSHREHLPEDLISVAAFCRLGDRLLATEATEVAVVLAEVLPGLCGAHAASYYLAGRLFAAHGLRQRRAGGADFQQWRYQAMRMLELAVRCGDERQVIGAKLRIAGLLLKFSDPSPLVARQEARQVLEGVSAYRLHQEGKWIYAMVHLDDPRHWHQVRALDLLRELLLDKSPDAARILLAHLYGLQPETVSLIQRDRLRACAKAMAGEQQQEVLRYLDLLEHLQEDVASWPEVIEAYLATPTLQATARQYLEAVRVIQGEGFAAWQPPAWLPPLGDDPFALGLHLLAAVVRLPATDTHFAAVLQRLTEAVMPRQMRMVGVLLPAVVSHWPHLQQHHQALRVVVGRYLEGEHRPSYGFLPLAEGFCHVGEAVLAARAGLRALPCEEAARIRQWVLWAVKGLVEKGDLPAALTLLGDLRDAAIQSP